MNTIQDLIDAVLALTPRLAGAQTREGLGARAAEVDAIEAQMQVGADRCLQPGQSAETLDLGAQLAQAAIDIGPASLALRTAAAWAGESPASPVLAEVLHMNLRLAQSSLLRALRPLSKVSPQGEWPSLAALPTGATGATAATESSAAEASGAADMDLGVLRNIANHHREHERFYTQDITESATDLYREANKLRIVAGVWLDGATPRPASNIDFSLPQYQAAGCEDLNALSSIAAIGVLFMEGDAEPAEIRMLKGKFGAVAGAWSGVGRWLSEKMDAAWQREQATCTPEHIGLAQARFNTITTNWRGAREMTLAGRLLMLAMGSLQTMDFTASGVRADRQGAGRRLLEISWVLAMAAQTRARSAADLAENDRNWTVYLDGLTG